MIAAGHAVYGFPGNCYWMDLGTPEKYLQAHFDLLAGQMRDVEYEAPWVAATADIEPGAIIGRRSSVGAEARVGPGATVEDSVIHPGASIGADATVRMTIVGPARTSARTRRSRGRCSGRAHASPTDSS